MYWFKNTTAFLISLVLCANTICSISFAQAEGEEKPVSTENFSGAQDGSWEKIFNDLTAFKVKLDSQATLVKSLIAEKAGLTGPALTAKIEEIKKEHQKYAVYVTEYNRKNEEFLTRYPERGLKGKRIYKRAKLKTIESFEDDFTFRGKINKLHRKILTQYPNASGVKSGDLTNSETKSVQPSIDVTTPIKVKK